jgi:uncharacterized protein (TIGR03437 family)
MRGLTLSLILLSLLPAAGFAAWVQATVPLPAGTTVTAIRFDSSGNIYIGGYATPLDLRSANNPSDGFVVKLSSDGAATIFRATLGGSGADQIRDIAIAPDGSVYAAGTTSSPDFPATAGSFGSATSKAFYAHFDSKGTLLSATLLAGAGDSSAEGIAVDNAGSVYLTGRLGTPAIGAYVTRFNAAGAVLFNNTTTGGNHIALDQQGNIYIAGTLLPPNLVPTTPGAFQTSAPPPQCPNSSRDLPCFHQYVSKLDPTGAHLLYSTFVAGSQEEGPSALAVDAQGNAYLAGSTTSPDYPVTPGAYQTLSLAGPLPKPTVAVGPSQPDPATGFVSKLNPSGTALLFSTFLGGSATDSITSLTLDAANNIYVAGAARSPDFPGLSGVPAPCASGAFVTRLSADGTALTATQLLYGIAVTTNSVVALDAAGNPWIAQGATLAHADLFAPSMRMACAVDSGDLAVLSQVAPGELISLFGDNLAAGDAVAAAPPANGSYPTTLNGVSVTFNGTPAPLLYVSAGQVNVQVPFEVASQATGHMQITMQTPSALVTETRDFAVAALAPSLFILEQGALHCGTQTIAGAHPAAYNADGTGNSCQNPAVRGSTVTVFLQGAGVTSPPQSTGAVVAQPPQPLNLPLANTDGSTRLLSAASAPGLISGVWAVQLQVPNGLTADFTVGGLPLRETTLVIWSK